ncbi:MAG: hypothetical protein P8Z30_04625 [Acidobacteriota bacterium]
MGTAQLNADQYRLLVAFRYLNAGEEIFRGLRSQQGVNDLYFVVTLRSFIEYSRRGIWFLVWASEEALQEAGRATFDKAASPSLRVMDEMINEALGQGRVSHLMDNLPGINEPFINCLHALTHGNPISVRMHPFGIAKIFNTEKLLARAELDLNIFRIVLYRRTLGEDITAIWKTLEPIQNRPGDVRSNVLVAADLLKKSGKLSASLGYQLPQGKA